MVDPTPDPDQVIPEYPDHICKQQLPGTSMDCAAIAFSYIANHFGATGLTSSDFAEMVGQNYSFMSAGLGGITNANMTTILSSVFSSQVLDGSFDSINNSLNNNHPVLAGIITGSNTMGHEVVIIDISQSEGTVTYMDPAFGAPKIINYNPSNFFELYSITGVQNNSFVNQYRNDTNDISFCSICNK